MADRGLNSIAYWVSIIGHLINIPDDVGLLSMEPSGWSINMQMGWAWKYAASFFAVTHRAKAVFSNLV